MPIHSGRTFCFLHILIRKWQSYRMMFPIEWRWTFPRARCFMSRIKLKTRAVWTAQRRKKYEQSSAKSHTHTHTLLHTNAAHSFTFQLLILWPLGWISLDFAGVLFLDHHHNSRFSLSPKWIGTRVEKDFFLSLHLFCYCCCSCSVLKWSFHKFWVKMYTCEYRALERLHTPAHAQIQTTVRLISV